MQNKAHIRVTIGEDGKTPVRELMFDGILVGELSYIETLELSLNATSSLRFEQRKTHNPVVAARYG